MIGSNESVMNMINEISAEYRKVLVSISKRVEEGVPLDVFTCWDEEVPKISSSILAILKPCLKSKYSGPKRALSAYIFFCREKRPQVKESFPEMKATEITKELAKMWKEIKETYEANEYIELATRDKTRYQEEMKLENQEENVKKTKKPKKDGPKRARSAYIFFCTHNREKVKQENSEMDSKEITSQLAKIWNSIKDTEDANEYIAMAQEDKIRYENETGTEQKEGETKTKRIPKKKNEIPAQNGFQLFCREQRNEVKALFPELSPIQVTKKLGEMWKELKVEEPETIREYYARSKASETKQVEP